MRQPTPTIAAAALAAVLAAAPAPAPAPAAAAAQDRCAERRTVVAFLADAYGEAPVGRGVANNGGPIEVFAAADGATWTILITMPDGAACMVAAGHSWERLPESQIPGAEERDPQS